MAGIGYWESPGNSPKQTRKFTFTDKDDKDVMDDKDVKDDEVVNDEEDVKDNEDFTHQRSRAGFIQELEFHAGLTQTFLLILILSTKHNS